MKVTALGLLWSFPHIEVPPLVPPAFSLPLRCSMRRVERGFFPYIPLPISPILLGSSDLSRYLSFFLILSKKEFGPS